MPPRLWKLMICQVIGSIGYYSTHLYFTDFMAVVNIKYFLKRKRKKNFCYFFSSKGNI